MIGPDTMHFMPDAPRGIAHPLYVRVEYERALRGWSSTRLRTETGVSRSTIGKWKTQERPPLPATVNAVADVLGIPREEALRLAGILPYTPADDRPQIVRDNWDDEDVRKVWGLSVPADQRLSIIEDILGRRPPAAARGKTA